VEGDVLFCIVFSITDNPALSIVFSISLIHLRFWIKKYT